MFSDCVARYLNPEKKKDKAERLTKKLKEQVKRFDLSGLAFPTPVSQIGVFENLNKISVMVLGWDDEKKCVVYLRKPGRKFKNAAKIFYHDGHYSTVKNMSALMREKCKDNASHYCLYHNRFPEKLNKHIGRCTIEKITIKRMPEEGSTVKFKNYKDMHKPFVIWADFESRMVKVRIRKGEKTDLIHQHVLSGYYLILVSRVDPSENRIIHYTAKNDNDSVAEHFLKTLDSIVYDLGRKYSEDKRMRITAEE